MQHPAPQDVGIPAAAVIIVTYNAADVVAGCLEALMPSGVPPPGVQIIVVDNASSDGTPALVQAQFPAVRLIANTHNIGYGAGNNQGVRAADPPADFIAIVNPDVRLTPEALAALVEHVGRHADVGMAGPRTLESSGEVAITARPAYTPLRVLAVYYGLARRFPRLAYGDFARLNREAVSPLDAAWLQGSCLVIRREVYDALGGFDEGFFLFAEDADLGDRAGQAGWRVVYLPHVLATHHGSTSVRRAHRISTRAYHLSPLHYFRRRGQYGAVWLLKAAFVLELAIKAGRRAWRGRVDPAAREEAAIYRETIGAVIRDRQQPGPGKISPP